MSVQVYSLLGQTEEEKKAFFRGCKKGGGGGHCEITPKEQLAVLRQEKLSSVMTFKIILPLLFRPPYK